MWINANAPFAQHWSFSSPKPAELPRLNEAESAWTEHPIDTFVLAKMTERGLNPSPPADRESLLRRVTMDLTGLPPTWTEMEEFVHDRSPDAYPRLIERLLASPAFGEHWGRKWLDMARYADSAGYADDPMRTIWAYRDWVVNAWNAGLPFDQFTREQLAGDLLPSPAPRQQIATAFHRNTLTNNEGGTNDEEFRNVAVVDRVNTTMAVWMGLTMACAQCHSHKYDPISQQEYFRLFAIFNQSQDADRTDESPRLDVFSEAQQKQRDIWEAERNRLTQQSETLDPSLESERMTWEGRMQQPIAWEERQPSSILTDSHAEGVVDLDGRVKILSKADRDTLHLEWQFPESPTPPPLATIELLTLPDPALPGHGAGLADGNFVITRVTGEWIPEKVEPTSGRYVRIQLSGAEKILSLAEVEVWSGNLNRALQGKATQSSTGFEGEAPRAIDGNSDGKYASNSTTHTANSQDPWWEVDLGQTFPIEKIGIFNRTDDQVFQRLEGAKVEILDEQRSVLWSNILTSVSRKPMTLDIVPRVALQWENALADHEQAGFSAEYVLDEKKDTGWAVGGAIDKPHRLSLQPKPLTTKLEAGLSTGWRLRLHVECQSSFPKHILASFRWHWTTDPSSFMQLQLPPLVQEGLRTAKDQRSTEQSQQLALYYQKEVAPSFSNVRLRIRELEKQLAGMKAVTSVPVMRDLASEKSRATFVQLRGNYKSLGERVEPGFPSAFHPWKPQGANAPKPGSPGLPTRLDLANWLMQADNPLTARVLVNRLWESLFGHGLVRTSEDFGSQGDLPTHPELLDWMALQLQHQEWDVKSMLRMIVQSATYQQQSKADRRRLEIDSENAFLSRGPRFRLSAEEVRDQSLAISGLLSHKMYGEPVRPRQPTSGLSAAFGSKTDWETSMGEDAYRRGLYTAWRRSNPYPSMATFDAPNREVCILRRDRTNTPLQALVTMNDPVYIEAAQGLARRILLADGCGEPTSQQIRRAFRLTLGRWPEDREEGALLELFERTRLDFAAHPERAKEMATNPLGPLPPQADPIDAAAWTVLCNVLLNLDEVLMTR